jgi:hypothetical protein
MKSGPDRDAAPQAPARLVFRELARELAARPLRHPFTRSALAAPKRWLRRSSAKAA